MFWFSESKSENLGPANHALPFVILNIRGVIIFCVFRVLDFIGHKKSGRLFNRKYHKKVKKSMAAIAIYYLMLIYLSSSNSFPIVHPGLKINQSPYTYSLTIT